MDTFRNTILHYDDDIKFLTGSYDKQNYQNLYTQYEIYLNKVKANAYTSKKMCKVDDMHIDYQPLLNYFEDDQGNCERLEDAKKAYHYNFLYSQYIRNHFEMDIPDIDSALSSNDRYIMMLTENQGLNRYYSQLSKNVATELVKKSSKIYKNSTYYYEPTTASSLIFFTGAMQSRTIHYIALLIIIGLCSLFTKDRQRKVKEEISTTKHGRRKVVLARLCASILYSISICITLTLFTFLLYAFLYDLSIGKVTLSLLYNFPTYVMSLFQFTGLYLGIILLCAIALSIFVSMISSFCKHNYTSFLITIFSLYCPVILYSSFMFIPFTKYSLLNTINVELLLSSFAGIEFAGHFFPTLVVIPCIYLLVIMLCGGIILYREKRTLKH